MTAAQRRRGRAIRKARRLSAAGRSPSLICRTLRADLAAAMHRDLAPTLRAIRLAFEAVARVARIPLRQSDYTLAPAPLPSPYAHRRPLLHNGRKHR